MPPQVQLPLTPRLKIWFESEGEYAFGFGLCEILEAIQTTGNIKDAAAHIGKSYRHVWGRVKDAEKILGQSLVQTRVGGKLDHRSELTDTATKMLEGFLSLREMMKANLEREFNQRFGKLSAKK